MASVRLLLRAEADLEEVASRYQGRSQQVARRFQNAVVAGLDRIAGMPEMYALVDDRHRLCPVHKFQYLLVYRYERDADEVVVVAIIHAKQDWSAWQRRN